jgi:hypothetical protein
MLLIGCSNKAAYMRGWQPSGGIVNRWQNGTFRADKLSSDEAAAVDEFGTPKVIRYFRHVETRQPVYEWLYEEEEEGPIIWFLEGKRVDYVPVDPSTSSLTRAERATARRKVITGSVLTGVVGGVAAGLLIFAPQLGLQD